MPPHGWGNLARKLERLHHWDGRFWARPYDLIPVSNEPKARVTLLRYILENGCKENLVMKPSDSPGLTVKRNFL